MPAPAVKGYMALCVTPRSQVCDEQGVGQWPMWKRFDSIKAIVDQYIDKPYRDFLARPEFDEDKQKPEEYFYWYTPRTDTVFSRLSCSGDDQNYYRKVLDETLKQYHSAVEQLKNEGKIEEANFLQLSLKYAGDSEDNVYCGDGRVVATVWGMRPRQGHDIHDSKLEADLFPPVELHTVQYELGDQGSTNSQTIIRKSHGTKIYEHQVPLVTASDGYEFMGWNHNPIGAVVNDDLLFVAQYRKVQQEVKKEPDQQKTDDSPVLHHVRFLMPDGQIIKELDVEHNKQILPGYIPQLPVIDGVQCIEWNGDPLNEVITSDKDYKAITPVKKEIPLHTVRFLNPNGDVLSKFQVEDGTLLTQSQIPPLPVVDGVTCTSWNANPLTERITSDKEFIAQLPEKKAPVGAGRGGCLSALLNWLLLLLGLLLLFLLLWCFIFGKCHFDLCGCNCDNVERTVIVKPEPTPTPPPNPQPIINDGDKVPKPTENCGVHFSGLVLSDMPSQDGIGVIFGNDPMGEYVGSGFYPDNSKTFPKAVQHTFDAIAVDKGTRLIIYRKPNFEGDVLLDVVGPALITNVLWKNDIRYNQVENKQFNSKLQALFPPSRRQWSSENMHDWSYGSCKIICQQCEEE